VTLKQLFFLLLAIISKTGQLFCHLLFAFFVIFKQYIHLNSSLHLNSKKKLVSLVFLLSSVYFIFF